MKSDADALAFLTNSVNEFQAAAMGAAAGPSADPNAPGGAGDAGGFDLASVSALFDLINSMTNADDAGFGSGLDMLGPPPTAGSSSPKSSAAAQAANMSLDWAFDVQRYDEDEAASKANTPDLVHPGQSVYLSPESAGEPGDHGEHASGNGSGGNGPPKEPVIVQEPTTDDPSASIDRYLSLEAMELVAGSEAAYYTPGLAKWDEVFGNDGSAAWAISQA